MTGTQAIDNYPTYDTGGVRVHSRTEYGVRVVIGHFAFDLRLSPADRPCSFRPPKRQNGNGTKSHSPTA